MHQLLDQERLIEPSKVTIQVSQKGMKIIQNVPKRSSKESVTSSHSYHHHHHHSDMNGSNSSSSSGQSPTNQKTEQIKHLIPQDSITTVVQEEDIVCCLLLIFNPVTRCPVHVHGYRCDSIETACSLTESLQQLIDRPENRKKIAEIEKRLAFRSALLTPRHVHHASAASSLRSASSSAVSAPESRHGLRLPSEVSSTRDLSRDKSRDTSKSTGMLLLTSTGHQRSQAQRSSSDGRSSTRTQGSDGTDDSNNSIARKEQLFESLAQELKVKLNPSSGPILLPPRDYDTISRSRGKLSKIEARKSTNHKIVGKGIVAEPTPYNSSTTTLKTVTESDNNNWSNSNHRRRHTTNHNNNNNNHHTLPVFYFGEMC